MFKKGDKVKIIGDYKGETLEVIYYDEVFDMYLVNGETDYAYIFGKNLELVSTETIESKKLLNSLYGSRESYVYCDTDSVQNELNHYLTDGNLENLLKDKNVERPQHYENNGKDLFDEWYERYYNAEKMYTGKEVFAEIMKAVAERYIRRYPNKNAEDIEKGIYTLIRLKEYNKEVTK